MSSAKSLSKSIGIAHQRRVWSRRSESWDHGDFPGIDKLVEQVLKLACPQLDMVAVDLGCGSGRLSIALAPLVSRVIGVDVSSAMLDRLNEKALEQGVGNLETRLAAIEDLSFQSGSISLVVSSYALHHLRDDDKQRLVKEAVRWLRPGGRLVIGDMMLGRGASRKDREIIASKAAAFLKKGPGGWWRLVKNAGRFLFRFQERPISADAWVRLFKENGLVDVQSHPVVAEACVVCGKVPTG